MPIEQGTVNTVFLEYEFKFLAQGFVDLARGPGEQLFPRHATRLATQTA